MKKTKKKITDFFEKLALFLYRKVIFVLLFFVIISVGAGYGIFHIFISKSLGEDFNPTVNTPAPSYDSLDYLQKNQKEKGENKNPFIEEEVEEVEGEPRIEEEEEDVLEETQEEDPIEEDPEPEEMTSRELESVLADNLFELYEFTDGELPSISERALVWEDLGLGDSEDYRGTYNQNILFLERLIEEMD